MCCGVFIISYRNTQKGIQMTTAVFDVVIRESGRLFKSFLVEKSWDEIDAYEAKIKAQYPSPNYSVEVFEYEEDSWGNFYLDPQY